MLLFNSLSDHTTYIVYLGEHSHGQTPSLRDLESATNSHHHLLAPVLGSHEKAKEVVIYSYNKHINGFAALLEEEEASEIAKNPSVISVFLSKEYKLHTTRSWDFLGMEKYGGIPTESAWLKGKFGEDTVIANLDSGVWPEHPSFSDNGFGPLPSTWRGNGVCQIDHVSPPNKTFCNRKLIGARIFSSSYEAHYGKLDPSKHTARDFVGHGTHTMSIAAGNFAPGATVFGNGNGTAKGGSPKARIAAYKVCWSANDAGLLDNVLSDYLWAKAVLLTSTTVATAGLTIQVPLAAIVDTLTGHAPGFMDYLGALSVMIGFTGINIPSDTFSKSRETAVELENESLNIRTEELTPPRSQD
ncbi:Peptidase S8 [Vigna unguiculata]|uniref:Peptidase S8 n=1 Tax=Vigna unguiculata TaxID=3917 RepID=A0A4D6LBT6_VIGUN|nr:Peptidase S8 [Vigna unguiculata]